MNGADHTGVRASRPMGQRLSNAQMRMLRRIHEHGDPWRGLKGRSQHGGAVGTIASLERMNLIAVDGGASSVMRRLTIDGNAALRTGRAP